MLKLLTQINNKLISTTYLELLLRRLNRLTLDWAVVLRMSIPQPPAIGGGTMVMGNADGLLIILSMESGSSSITPGRIKSRSRCSSRQISSGFSLILVVFFFFFFSSLVDVMLARLSLSESELMRNGIDIADNSRRSCILYFYFFGSGESIWD